MAATGRPPKPIEAHKRTGTFNVTRHKRGSLVLVEPVEMPTEAQPLPQVLQDVLRMGVSWLARTDAVALALLRSMLEEREPLRVDAVAGSTESRKALRDLDRQIAGLLSSLGFTPTDRTRMGVAEVQAVSKLEAIQARAAKR